MTASAFLPYGRQTIEDDDVAAVAAALRADHLTTGPTVARFETAFAQATGAAHAVACNSGTAALHLAALALDLGPGDGAVVPSATFLATANAVRMTGAEVAFADVDPETGLMTAAALRAALARGKAAGLRMRAAFPVHLNGQLCDMAALAEVAADAKLALVEDACHALGVANVGACAYSAVAAFSTHPVKAIATGEGGVATTSDARLAQRMSELRSHGMVRDAASFEHRDAAFDDGVANPWYYEMPEIGWNYRLPDVLCALGLSQLPKLARFQARRREIAALYDTLLAPLAPVLRPVPHGKAPHGWHLYAVLLDFAALGTTRRRFMEALRAQGIGSQVHYGPVHAQPYYVRRYGALELPGVAAYTGRCLSIPFYPSLSDDDVRRTAKVLADVVAAGGRA
ncbi:MAG: UDP-4-amino-4,6-dideoxy-N-acetyl-beta-L-altrosamine transaminase [Telmatospirillum sp.]|nr:UDP-4-amino-4,6-dideoxy-N-acetyl-beta-L-altrosamine transaminase [Telmatospirillum sp.]